MSRWLPAAVLSIVAGIGLAHLAKAGRTVLERVFDQSSARKLAHVDQCLLESLRIPGGIKHDRVEMRGHYHVGADPQVFVRVTEVEAVGDDLAGCLRHKNGQPLDDRKRHEICRRIRDESIALHSPYLAMGDLRSGLRRGQRPAPNASTHTPTSAPT